MLIMLYLTAIPSPCRKNAFKSRLGVGVKPNIFVGCRRETQPLRVALALVWLQTTVFAPKEGQTRSIMPELGF